MQPIVLMDKDHSAKDRHSHYTFRSNKIVNWPKYQGRGLGSCGMWNFLWRMGFHPQRLVSANLPHPSSQNILFIDKNCTFEPTTQEKIKQWLNRGGKVVAAGELAAWENFLPSSKWKTTSFENPYAGGSYVIDAYSPQIVMPPAWSFIESEFVPNLKNNFCMGHIATVQGERQTPKRALITIYEKAPAIIINNTFYYFNGHPFSAFQAWLQGQEDLSPWLAWRHRLFWLDEWCSFFYDLMLKLGIFDIDVSRAGIDKLQKNTIILKHDLDYSRDVSFLKHEDSKNIGATYAVLKDKNTHFWKQQLQNHHKHEIAFHYNTGKRNLLGMLRRFFLYKNTPSFVHNLRAIKGNRLLKQIKWAAVKGINVETIHRHLCFLIYPELIDALDHVYESNLNVLGSNTLFRGHVLRWGIDRIEGHYGYLTDWPDCQFPLWYPFKLAHAANHGKILKGWELSSMMEVEPEVMLQMLEYKIKHIRQNIFTVNFHPAHAIQSSLYKNGSFTPLKVILEIFENTSTQIFPMNKVLQNINTNFNGGSLNG